MRIRKIRIEGFRAIREPLELEWVDPAGEALARVILAGPNGSGKTSVLEGLLLALGREELVVRDLPAIERGDHWRVVLSPGAQITVECEDEPTVPDFFGPNGEFTVARSADHWELRGVNRAGDELVWSSEFTIRKFLQQIPVEYFSSWRSPILPGGLQPTTRGRQPTDNEANRLRRLKQRIINERARRAFVRAPAAGEDERWLARLNEVWAAFHDDGSTIDADVVDADADDPIFDVFVFDGTERRCSIDQVSSGELELLTMAGTLILGDFAGLLLIDEPELHLHPQWQGQLMDALHMAAPGAQLVVSTHADAPWDAAYSFERFFLAPAGDPRVGLPLLAAVRGD